MRNGVGVLALFSQRIGQIVMRLREIRRHRKTFLELSDRFVEHSFFRKHVADVAGDFSSDC